MTKLPQPLGKQQEEGAGRALQEQKRTGSKLGRTVVDLGFVAEVKLLTALSEQLKIPFIELKHFKFDANLVQTLPEAMARRFRAIVLSREGGGVLVGMSDPLDLFALDEMERILKTRVNPAVVREAELLATLDLVYRRTSQIASIAGELGMLLDDLTARWREAVEALEKHGEVIAS